MSFERVSPERIIRFEFVLLFDCEFTCREGSAESKWSDPEFPPEAIQLGYVLYDIKSQVAVKKYFSNIKPVKNTILSGYCRNLLGISQYEIDSAKSFAIVSSEIQDELKKHDSKRILTCSWGVEDREYLEITANLNCSTEPFDRLPYLDLQRAAAVEAGIGDIDRASREDVKKAFGLGSGKYSHNALDDAEDLIEMFEYLRNQYA